MSAQNYRPTTFDEIVGQPTDEIEAQLLNSDDPPDFLFHGPPGTGKTTTAYVIARHIQGDAAELMEFNASDDRGIDTVREDIIPATKQTTLSGRRRVVFLDEMESMTADAQQALRRPMETSDAVFILACNDIEGVHDAIQSRCATYEFDEIADTAIRQRIKQIAADEGVSLDTNELSMIVGFANGDMRSAIQRYTQVARGVYPDDDGDDGTTDNGTLEIKAHEYLEDE